MLTKVLQKTFKRFHIYKQTVLPYVKHLAIRILLINVFFCKFRQVCACLRCISDVHWAEVLIDVEETVRIQHFERSREVADRMLRDCL